MVSWGNTGERLLNFVCLQIDERLMESQPIRGVRKEDDKFWGPIGFMKALCSESSYNRSSSVNNDKRIARQ